MTDRSILIGVDTGGTYTDAVVIDAADRSVLSTAKSLTTRGDLALGVAAAIRAAMSGLGDRVPPSAVGLVAVSTTLATNAVVEGHGGPVAVLLVGFDEAMATRTGIAAAFPGMAVARVGGGHDHAGREQAPLDEAAVLAALDRHAGAAEAFAVAAQFAVRNPEHERRVRDLVVARTGLPVTLSTELSSALDAPRRALTAVLNARLISRITRLVAAVRRAAADVGIVAPLMIVKGDGTLAAADTMATRPIETVLSGPAASLVGARFLSGAGDFILSDMGGTTTDLAVVAGGRPRIAAEGADLGGWRTMVRAIDVRTVGLGGDSEASFDPKGAIALGPGRVVPLSLLADRHPAVLDILKDELARPTVSGHSGRFAMRPPGAAPDETPSGLPAREAELFARIGATPVPLASLVASPSQQRALSTLRARGLVQLAGLTPSDAAHVLGLQRTWSAEAASMGFGLAVRLLQMRRPTPEAVEALATALFDETVRLSTLSVLGTAIGPAAAFGPIVEAVCRGETRVGLAAVSLAPTVPVLAVGGPVRVFYPAVAARLGADVRFPDHYEVANAIGAATAIVSRTVEVAVTGDGDGLYRVHTTDGVIRVAGGAEAIAAAEAAARSGALEAAAAMGADRPQATVTVTRRLLPGASDDSGLFDAVVAAEASGPPQLRPARSDAAGTAR